MEKHTETEFIIQNWFYKCLLSTYYVSGITYSSPLPSLLFFAVHYVSGVTNSSPLPSLLFFAVHRSKKQPEWESLGGFKIFTYIPKNTHQISGWNAWTNFSTERIVNNNIFSFKHTHTFYLHFIAFILSLPFVYCCAGSPLWCTCCPSRWFLLCRAQV